MQLRAGVEVGKTLLTPPPAPTPTKSVETDRLQLRSRLRLRSPDLDYPIYACIGYASRLRVSMSVSVSKECKHYQQPTVCYHFGGKSFE